MLNIEKIKSDFPILKRKVNGEKPLIYLDSAATTQKPLQVIDAISNYYKNSNANVHRGVYSIGHESTEMYENARKKVAKFINAKSENSIVFTRNATESINLIAKTYAKKFLKANDEILVSQMEHHSNLIPWQIIAEESGAKLKFIPLIENGILDLTQLEKLISQKTKIISLVHVSNTLGTINPIEKIISLAHSFNAKILIDASQSVPHMEIDVEKLDCDFLVFSGHKMLAPTGIGVLYGKENLLEELPPFLSGGEMISEVHLETANYRQTPWKFEAGTPNVSGTIALSTAIDYLLSLGMGNIHKHEIELTQYAIYELNKIPEIKIFGPTENRGNVVSFNFENIHPHDISTILDNDGICIRAGHNCTQPIIRWLNVSAVARVSFYIYNTKEDIDIFISSLKKVKKIFYAT